MFLTKLKLAAAALFLIATGSVVLVSQATAQKPAARLGAAEKADPPAAGATPVPDDAIDLEMLERAWVDAINRRDTAVVRRIIADDFASIDSTGRWVTRADYMLTVLNGAVPAEEIVQDEIKIRVFGDSAVVTSRIKLKTTPTWHGLTNVYVKQQGRWRCVASQATWIRPRQAPPPSQTTNRHKDTHRPQDEPLVEQLRVSQEKPEIAEMQNALLREDLKKERASVHSNHQAGARSPDAAVPASGQPASGAGESNVHLLQQVFPAVFPAQRAEHVIQPRFECLVERVYVKAGQTVKKGAALVDVSSIELAAAKNDYLTKELQLKHHQMILGMRRKLFEEKAISEQVWTDTQNDEEKSKLEFQVARDKLKYFGLDDEAIGLVGKEDGDRKARLTLRAPVDGIVSKVDLELGNLYEKSMLLIVRPTSSGQSTQP